MEEMVNIERAIEIVDRSVKPLGPEQAEVMLSSGRILAESASAWVDLPGSDISMLDGYALHGADTKGAGAENRVVLKVAGETSFINLFTDPVPPGECIKIYTGCPLPEGTDAVVGEEYVVLEGDGIEVSGEVSAGDGVRKRAEEFRMGEFVVEAGQLLTPGWISLLIAAGWGEVNVIRLPRVRVVAVGDELKMPGATLETGQVFASGGSGVVAWCRSLGVSEVRLTLSTDDPYDVQEALPGPGEADLAFTIGGTGRSDRDVVIDSVAEIGGDILFRGVGAKPGTFTAMGMLGEVPLLCLPGGPGAVDAMFQLLGRRMVYALMGIIKRDLKVHHAVLAEAVSSIPDIDRLVRVGLEMGDKGLAAVPGKRGGGLHREIAQADGILRVPAGKDLAAGERVPVWITR